MSNSMTDNLVNDIKQNLQNKIKSGEVNGDINQQLLILLSDVHDKVEGVEGKVEDVEEEVEKVQENWAFSAGKFLEERTQLSIFIAQIAVLILVLTSLAGTLLLIDQLGLSLVMKP